MYVLSKLATNPPSASIISLVAAKAHLRLDHNDDDILVASLIEAAEDLLQARTWRSLQVQGWRMVLDDYNYNAGGVRLRMPPVIGVDRVLLRDAQGIEALLAPANYWFDVDFGWLRFNDTSQLNFNKQSLIIEYQAGYAALPKAMEQAVKLLIGHWYDNPAMLVDGRMKQMEDCPASVTNLLEAFSARDYAR